MNDLVANAVADRASGDRPGRVRSVLAATAVGLTCAALAYRLLRHDDTIDYSPSEGAD